MTIKQGSIFPWHFRLFGVILIAGGMAVITLNIALSIIIGLVGLLLATGQSGITFNRDAGNYKFYYSFVGLPFGKVLQLKAIEKVYLNRNMEKRTMYTAHTAARQTFENEVFDGYLKFEDGEKIYLTSDKTKASIVTQLTKLAEYLTTELVDNTGTN